MAPALRADCGDVAHALLPLLAVFISIVTLLRASPLSGCVCGRAAW